MTLNVKNMFTLLFLLIFLQISCNQIKNNNEERECEPGQKKPCGSNIGECIKGNYECQGNGTWSEDCQQGTNPTDEDCDGLDNNCDGETDENVKTIFYKDNDNDGYGNPDEIIEDCELPDKYVTNSTDCNDSLSNVHPNADEIDDGIDNDCNGQTDDLIDISEDIIKDNENGLMWQKLKKDAPNEYPSAFNFCRDLEHAGYSDWRLPTVSEYKSILDNCTSGIDGKCNNCSDSKKCSQMFSEDKGWFWTSDEFNQQKSWSVNFDDGTIAHLFFEYYAVGARCIRIFR